MERLMQYVWQHRLWNPRRMVTVDGRPVHVIDPGRINTDAGPDFFNAKIRIGSQLWVGDIEIHVKASDWFRHNHTNNRAYDSVVLHVVAVNDALVTLPTSGESIPQVVMQCDENFSSYYSKFIEKAGSELPCASILSNLQTLYVTDWIEALALERLHDKTERIKQLLRFTVNSWEEVCYITLARALGTGINGDAFQRLALITPLRLLRKHSDSITSIESILLGQAGMLEENRPADPRYSTLQREYRFFKAKFGLKTPDNLNWKMARIRPGNSPANRIRTLAAFIAQGFRLTTDILDIENETDALALFENRLGKTMASSMVINVAAPILYGYGNISLSARKGEQYEQKAIYLLEVLMPEKNFIVSMFEKSGIRCKNAFDSQALIQLRRNYCDQRKCLFCRFGHRIMADRAVKKNNSFLGCETFELYQ